MKALNGCFYIVWLRVMYNAIQPTETETKFPFLLELW